MSLDAFLLSGLLTELGLFRITDVDTIRCLVFPVCVLILIPRMLRGVFGRPVGAA